MKLPTSDTPQSTQDQNQPMQQPPLQQKSHTLEEQGSQKIKIERLQKQVAEYLSGWQRAKADYLNLKKQNEREREELMKFANAAVLFELFPVYDHFKIALSHVPKEQQQLEWVKGFSHILSQFKQFFREFGIEEIKTVGEQFHHDLHHAVAKIKKEGVASNTILAELSSGFMMQGKTIIPAKVQVAE